MTSKRKVTISWSGGKDSAFALYKILAAGEYDVVSLHTVFDQASKRVGLHGVRESLIDEQAAQVGLPLRKIYLNASLDHSLYESAMRNFYGTCRNEGIDGVVFGDIFLEDLKDFRSALLKPHELVGIFPLWKADTKKLLKEFIDLGFKTTLCSADAKFFSQSTLGVMNCEFLEQLPPMVDPCGENGEFHTFVFDGPLFKEAISFSKGEIVKKTYHYQKKESSGELVPLESSFWFQDLLHA
ncbi:MAG TPA: diphthine--ammonia ligase [Chryseolinea sp.]